MGIGEREGIEVTPKWGINYKGERVRILTGDLEYHVVSDIAPIYLSLL